MTMIPDASASATGFDWPKSTFSGGQSDCVEAALRALPSALPVRDSKVPTGPTVDFSGRIRGAFIDAVKRGHLADAPRLRQAGVAPRSV